MICVPLMHSTTIGRRADTLNGLAGIHIVFQALFFEIECLAHRLASHARVYVRGASDRVSHRPLIHGLYPAPGHPKRCIMGASAPAGGMCPGDSSRSKTRVVQSSGPCEKTPAAQPRPLPISRTPPRRRQSRTAWRMCACRWPCSGLQSWP